MKRFFSQVNPTISLFVVMLLLSINQSSAQTLVAKYVDLSISGNPFTGYGTPISIAILKFQGNDQIDGRLFDALKQEPNVLSGFTIYSYAVLKAQIGPYPVL